MRGSRGPWPGGYTSRRELEEFADLSNVVEGKETVIWFHDLLHMLLPDIPEPRAKGPLPGASGPTKAAASANRDGRK